MRTALRTATDEGPDTMHHLSLPLTVTTALLLGGLSAQDDPNVAKRDAKLASPFLTNGDWVTDYTAARERAKKEGKLIFAYFTRSFQP